MLVCNKCKVEIETDDGHSQLSLTNARVDEELFTAGISAGVSLRLPRTPQVDLCHTCTTFVARAIGLPPDAFFGPTEIEDRMRAEIRTKTGVPDAPLAGALSDDDLKQLGIDP